MSLIANTRHLLTGATGGTSVEYHFRSSRELYDGGILTADRHHSSAGQWVLFGPPGDSFYSVRVASRPTYRVPQELCLSFRCFATTTETRRPGGGATVTIDYPFRDTAAEFIALLSVFVRDPLVPLGLRRQDDIPLAEPPSYVPLGGFLHGPSTVACAVPSDLFRRIIKALPGAAQELGGALLGAAKFYQSALSFRTLDRSLAYAALISAVECLAGHHLKQAVFDFDDIDKFSKLRPLLARIDSTVADSIRRELVAREHFVRNKFASFLSEFVTDAFWDLADDLYPDVGMLPAITRETFPSCVKRAYDARSEFLHGGNSLPHYVELGARSVRPSATHEVDRLQGKKAFIPTLAWLERLVQDVFVEFARRTLFADELKSERDTKKRLRETVEQLDPERREALERLVRWTAQFVGYSVVGPQAPNRDWARSLAVVVGLREAGFVTTSGDDLDGTSSIRDRVVGEVLGDVFFGVRGNPMRGAEVLLPKEYVDAEVLRKESKS